MALFCLGVIICQSVRCASVSMRVVTFWFGVVIATSTSHSRLSPTVPLQAKHIIGSTRHAGAGFGRLTLRRTLCALCAPPRAGLHRRQTSTISHRTGAIMHCFGIALTGNRFASRAIAARQRQRTADLATASRTGQLQTGRAGRVKVFPHGFARDCIVLRYI